MEKEIHEQHSSSYAPKMTTSILSPSKSTHSTLVLLTTLPR